MISDPQSAMSYNATVSAPLPLRVLVTLYGSHCARATCILIPSSETRSRKNKLAMVH